MIQIAMKSKPYANNNNNNIIMSNDAMIAGNNNNQWEKKKKKEKKEEEIYICAPLISRKTSMISLMFIKSFMCFFFLLRFIFVCTHLFIPPSPSISFSLCPSLSVALNHLKHSTMYLYRLSFLRM